MDNLVIATQQDVNTVARHTPRPHQGEAMAAILKELSVAPRATAVQPCGSGKTLVELWVAEGLQANTVVVFEPTRALVCQTMKVFQEPAKNRDTRFLACSSDTQADREDDDEVLDVTYGEFEATTDVETVRRFLTEGKSPNILIATYQSAHVVKAALPASVTIDLAIFDEAHKTAGRVGKTFAAALDDSWLPVARRLFLTATPRHTEITGPDTDRSETVVYSMDNTALYGRVVYTITYQEAVKCGIIPPFRVVIAVVTHREVSDAIGRGLRLDHPDNRMDVSARQVAQWVALRKTMLEFKLRKAFTFHETVQAAKSFLDMDNLVPAVTGHEISCLHINGTHNHKERADRFHEFQAARCAVLSNARCLTEGVGVPSVDLVAFNSNRRSVTDIVQGTGRCQRLADGKEAGYVLLPVFIDQREDETAEQAAERADLGEVGAVLRALAEQDEQIIDHIRIAGNTQAARENQDTRFIGAAEVVTLRVFGEGVDISKISIAITTRVLNRICSTWDDHYERLRQDTGTHGLGWVPRRKSSNDYDAYPDWVAKQRRLKRNGKLSSERIAKLDKLGFPWEIENQSESRKCAEALLAILSALPVKRKKRFNLYRREHELGAGTLELLNRVRYYKQHGCLAEAWLKRLDDVGMVWEALSRRDKLFRSELYDLVLVWHGDDDTSIVSVEELAAANPSAAALYRDVATHPVSPEGHSVAHVIATARARLEPQTWAEAMMLLSAGHDATTLRPELAKSIMLGIIRRQQRKRLKDVDREYYRIAQTAANQVHPVVDGMIERLSQLASSLYDPEIPRLVIADAVATLKERGCIVRWKYDNSFWYQGEAVRIGTPGEYVEIEGASELIADIRETCHWFTGKTICLEQPAAASNKEHLSPQRARKRSTLLAPPPTTTKNAGFANEVIRLMTHDNDATASVWPDSVDGARKKIDPE